MNIYAYALKIQIPLSCVTLTPVTRKSPAITHLIMPHTHACTPARVPLVMAPPRCALPEVLPLPVVLETLGLQDCQTDPFLLGVQEVPQCCFRELPFDLERQALLGGPREAKTNWSTKEHCYQY